MDVLPTRVDTRGAEYRENFAAMKALVDELRHARLHGREVLAVLGARGVHRRLDHLHGGPRPASSASAIAMRDTSLVVPASASPLASR